MVRMVIYRVGLDPEGRPLVLLADEEEQRVLPIWVGPFEAHAIATQMRGETFARPLTHDLLRSVIETLEYRLERVEITKVEDSTFYAVLLLNGPLGTFEVDSRPSDAMALALRTDTEIYVAEEVLATSEVFIDEKTAEEVEKFRDLLSHLDAGEEPGPEVSSDPEA
jgi:uncharacterized protein